MKSLVFISLILSLFGTNSNLYAGTSNNCICTSTTQTSQMPAIDRIR